MRPAEIKKGARCQPLTAGLRKPYVDAVLRLVALPAKNEQDITRTDNHYTTLNNLFRGSQVYE